MNRLLMVFAVVLAFVACQPKAEKAPKIAMEDFFRNPEKTAFRLSPNGEYFSYLAPWEKRLNVFVQKVGADSAVRVTSETARDIAGYLWKGNNRILFLKDTGGDENFQLYGVNTDGTELEGFDCFRKSADRINRRS